MRLQFLACLLAWGPQLSAGDASHGGGCPGSPAGMHAWLSIDASVSVSCENARAEVLARVAGQGTNKWTDPHGGTYTLVSDAAEGITVSRLSANGRYTDHVLLKFVASGSSCNVASCSESQGSSMADQSTNLCNSWNLLCTNTENCCHVSHDLGTFSYSVSGKSSAAGSSISPCLGGEGGSGGGSGGNKQTLAMCPSPSPAPGPEPEPEPTPGSTNGSANSTATGTSSGSSNSSAGSGSADNVAPSTTAATAKSEVAGASSAVVQPVVSVLAAGLALMFSLHL